MADCAPRKRAKLAEVGGSKDISLTAAQIKLDHKNKLATKDNDTEEIAASIQVWNTTELLEHIISCLPGKSIVVVSGINNVAYNCVANSSIAQSKLFMRPSGHAPDHWVYCEFYLPRRLAISPGRQVVAQCFEPTMDAFHQVERTGGVDGMAKWVSVVSLCPLLELDDTQESTALGRLKRKGWQEDERAHLTGLPAENTKYADMFLTDPPTYKVQIEVTYKHSLKPLLMIRAKRHVVSTTSPLTVGAVLESACTQPGDTYLHEPAMPANNYNASHRFLKSSTINDVIVQTLQEHGGSFALDLSNSEFVFKNRRSKIH
ncbi:hypothetical protein MBLNU13_g07068t2 [Cladosporium sp. NU13]